MQQYPKHLAGLADLVEQAAGMLNEEAVQYALGLDHDHDQTSDRVEVFDAKGKSRGFIDVEVDRDEAYRAKEQEIADHARFTSMLERLAAELRSNALPLPPAGWTVECAAGGSGQCDGVLLEGGFPSGECDCPCHYADDLPSTVEGVKTWHENQ